MKMIKMLRVSTEVSADLIIIIIFIEIIKGMDIVKYHCDHDHRNRNHHHDHHNHDQIQVEFKGMDLVRHGESAYPAQVKIIIINDP